MTVPSERMPERLLTVGEAAKYLACGPVTIRTMVREGRLRAVKATLRGPAKIPVSAVIAYQESLQPATALLRNPRNRGKDA